MRDFDPARRVPDQSTSPMGWIIALLGLLLLVASYQMVPDDLGGALPAGLRTVAWLGIVLGVLLALLQRRQRKAGITTRIEPSHEDEADAYPPGATRPSVLAALGIARAPSVPEPAFVDTIAVPTSTEEIEEDEPRADNPVRSVSPTPAAVRWSPLLLQRFNAEQFLELCRSFFSQAGFATSVAAGPDEQHGADLWVQSRHMPDPRIVRCRHWQASPVDARQMREFLRSMSEQNLQHGTYVTSATFTAEAADFAKANGIQVQDGPALLRLISHRTVDQQRELMAAALGPDKELPTTTIAGAL